ncbi:hypothetical protein MMC17_009814 [Xylographa soralifera]|nr:hypothetical protein [Xylographa soralifera]
MGDYGYTYLPLGHIRLLSIKAGSDPPAIDLEVCSLEVLPDYDALSYTWGEAHESRSISCCEAPLEVRINLYQVLKQLSNQKFSRKIWIDAVCIDQDSSREKNEQIPLMHDIYTGAKTVLVWLGEATEDEQNAIGKLPLLSLILSRQPPLSVTLHDFVRIELPHSKDVLWQAVCQIYLRPWFRRLWTVQELILAKEITILCGTTHLPWVVLSSATSSLCSMQNILAPVSYAFEHETQSLILLGGLAVLALERYRRNGAQSLTDIHTLLGMFKNKELSVPVDRVYGMLGLISEEYSGDIAVDVNLPVEKVYQSFSMTCLRHDPHLSLLHWISPDRNGPNFPSWCLNLNCPLELIPKGRARATDEADGFHAGYLPPSSSPKSLATIDVDSLHQRLNPEVSFPRPHILRVKGLSIDTVSQIIDNHPKHWSLQSPTLPDIAQWEARCLTLMRTTFKDHRIPPSYARMLISNNLLPSNRDALGIYGQQHHSDTAFRVDYLPIYEDARTALRYGGLESLRVQNPTAYEYLESMFMACYAYRFFGTENGRIGLCLPGVKPGDRVCVLYGGTTPFVLSPQAGGVTWRSQGEAYVEGLMYEEAMQTRERGEVQDVNFDIV